MSPLIKSCLALKIAIEENVQSGELFNEQLKNTAMSTFVFAVLFSLVLIA
jgi:1,4-dihydroxy-2-naphthoate octaprenyltransferase